MNLDTYDIKNKMLTTAVAVFAASSLLAQPASATVEFPQRVQVVPDYLAAEYNANKPFSYNLVPCAAKGEGPIYWTATTAPEDAELKPEFVRDLTTAYSYVTAVTGGRIAFEYVDTSNMAGHVQVGLGVGVGSEPTFWQDTRIRHTNSLTRPVIGSFSSSGGNTNPNSTQAHVKGMYYDKNYSLFAYEAGAYVDGVAALGWPTRNVKDSWIESGYALPSIVTAADISFNEWKSNIWKNDFEGNFPSGAQTLFQHAATPLLFEGWSSEFTPFSDVLVSDRDYYLLNFVADDSCNYDYEAQFSSKTPNDQRSFGVNNYIRSGNSSYVSLGKLATTANAPAGWSGVPKAPIIADVTTALVAPSQQETKDNSKNKKKKCKKKYKKDGKKKKYKKCLRKAN